MKRNRENRENPEKIVKSNGSEVIISSTRNGQTAFARYVPQFLSKEEADALYDEL